MIYLREWNNINTVSQSLYINIEFEVNNYQSDDYSLIKEIYDDFINKFQDRIKNDYNIELDSYYKNNYSLDISDKAVSEYSIGNSILDLNIYLGYIAEAEDIPYTPAKLYPADNACPAEGGYVEIEWSSEDIIEKIGKRFIKEFNEKLQEYGMSIFVDTVYFDDVYAQYENEDDYTYYDYDDFYDD